MGTVDLAKAERVRQQSMGQTLAELEAQGMVARRADPGDKRRTLLELTAAGRERLAEERARRDGWLAQAIAAQLSRDEQKSLAKVVELLERLARG
jgi:DNA-binding MarR family transcriptional regulator